MKPGDVSPYDPDEGAIFLDHSTLSTFRHCEEKARLQHVLSLKPREGIPALDFGSMFHAGVEAWNMLISGYMPIVDEKNIVKYDHIMSHVVESLSFETQIKLVHQVVLSEMRHRSINLPLGLQDNEKRSIERCLNLTEAYCNKWKAEPLELLKDKSTGRPYVEIKFRIFLFTYKDGRPVFYCGIIDSLKRSRLDERVKINETKTTSIGLEQYKRQIRPNHQVTGYIHSVRELLGMDVNEAIWDCTFVSSRKGDPKGDYWESRGIDMVKDFMRTDTKRSITDLDEWLYDTQLSAERYLARLDSDLPRWERNAPGGCHNYGGCTFREVCGNNLNKAYMDAKFKVEKWEPWKNE